MTRTIKHFLFFIAIGISIIGMVDSACAAKAVELRANVGMNAKQNEMRCVAWRPESPNTDANCYLWQFNNNGTHKKIA